MITVEDTFRSYASKVEEIYNSWAKVTAEGTNITLSPTRKGKIKIDTLKGNTFQKQLSGKNLCQTIYSGYYNVETGNLVANNAYRTFIAENITAGDYVFSTDLSNCRILRVWKDNSNTNIAVDRNTQLITTTQAGKVMICVRNTSSTDITEDVLGQIETGSTVTDYEEYCGGVPSPNPQFPQNIENVTGNITITVSNGTQEKTIIFPLAEGQKLMEGDYLANDGVHHNMKQEVVSGSTVTFNDAKQNGSYVCTQKISGNLNGKTLTFDTAVVDAIVEYELAEEVIEPYTEAQIEALNSAYSFDNITNITTTGNLPVIIKASALKKGGN